MKLQNVGFYLSDIGDNWYRNREDSITDRAAFAEQIRQRLGSSAGCSDAAKKKLDMRVQHHQETYTPYIEDVLALCRRVDKDMCEADRVRHIMKGISQFAYSSLALQNPATVVDVAATCQRLDELQSIRLQQDTQASPPHLGNEKLRTLIRSIIREKLCNHPSPCATSRPVPASALREMVQEELASMSHLSQPGLPTQVTTPSYSEVASRPPLSLAPVTIQPNPEFVTAVPEVSNPVLPPDMATASPRHSHWPACLLLLWNPRSHLPFLQEAPTRQETRQ